MADNNLVILTKATINKIVRSVLNKTGKTGPIKPKNLPTEIDSIITAANVPTGTKYIDADGTYPVSSYASVEVNVEKYTQIKLDSNGTHSVSGYKEALVDVPNTIPENYVYVDPESEINISENDDYDVTNIATVKVNVPTSEPVEEWDGSFEITGEPIIKQPQEVVATPNLETQTFTPNPNSYISKVTVEPIPEEYIPEPSETGVVIMPDFYFFLKEDIDFSMIPSNIFGRIHYIRFDFTDDGTTGPYMGLYIGDGELKAVPISEPTSHLTIYDSTGWDEAAKYRSIHMASAAVSRELYLFMFSNNTTKISFSVGSTTLYAEEGMTWGEWVSSSFNTSDFTINNGAIAIGSESGMYVLNSDGLPVLKTAKIVNGGTYTVESYSGIFFSINGTPYYAVSGWSWATWVANPAYNYDEFKVIPGSNLVQTAGGATVKAPDGTTVTSGASIVADHAYSA